MTIRGLSLLPTAWRIRRHVICVAVLLSAGTWTALADEPVRTTAADAQTMWRIQLNAGTPPATVEGRIVVEAQDGGLIAEERNGRLRQLQPADIATREQLAIDFSLMTADELARDLLAQAPPGFEIHRTEHYVLCTNSSDEYADFCGKLLERVFAAYFEFMSDLDIPVTHPAAPMPVLIFHSATEFQTFATAQHPETSFADTPGSYSIRDNQTLLTDLTRDRSLRSAASIRNRLGEQPLQVATVVHEAVHQLAFNSGLQVRLADNPLWLTEGLAMYFEQLTPRSSMLWTKPGQVNARHQPAFVQLVADDMLDIPLSQLVSSDQPFLQADQVAKAYAESWALTSYLIREHKSGLKTWFATISKRKPLQPVSETQRVEEFRAAFGKLPDELTDDVTSYVRRLRVPRS